VALNNTFKSLVREIAKKKTFTLKYKGNSMYPNLKEGFIVTVANKTIVEGDIAVFINKNALVSHRVLYIKKNKYYLKGDNKFHPDKPITKEKILGKIIKIKTDDKKEIIPKRLSKIKLMFLKFYIKTYFFLKRYRQ